jgi:ABC-type glycerol-3-phosphate transport system permease component
MMTRKKFFKNITFSVIFVYSLLIVIGLTMVLPFVHEWAKSFSFPTEAAAGRVALWPKHFTLGNYEYFYRNHLTTLTRAFRNSIFITGVGVLWITFNIALFAFPLSRPDTEFRLTKPIMYLVLFTLVFSPPVIPYFLAIKSYGLMDTHWALILPHTVLPFELILVITFFRQLPEEMFDACRIDGGNDYHLFRHVALPLSKAVLVTVALFASVGLWNIFFHAMLFLRDPKLQPLQVFVRGILQAGGDMPTGKLLKDPFAETESTKSAIILLTTLPIILVYPMLQRYFAKGVLLGAIKE